MSKPLYTLALTMTGLLLCLIATGCSDKKESEIVAAWGDVHVTLSDFERSYFYYWQTTHRPDSPELRRQYAIQMIEEELIADSALTSGLVAEKDIRSILEREQDYFLRRRYLEKTVRDTLTPITEAELQEALHRNRIRLRVRQLYARTEDSIRVLEAQLKQGVDFEKLARQTIPDPLFAMRDGDLGWIGWGDTDLPVEDLLYSMERGDVSEPVESLMGWHIFRIDSIEKTIDFNTSDDPFEVREIRQKLFRRKLEMAGARHYRDLIWSKPLRVHVSLFKDLWRLIEPHLPGNTKERALFAYQGIETDLTPTMKNDVLAEVDGEPFTIGEFIRSIPDLPRHLMRPNLKKAVEVAVRDKIVKNEALKRGIDQDPVVQEKVRRSRIKYLYYRTLAVLDSLEKARFVSDGPETVKSDQTYYPRLHENHLPSSYEADKVDVFPEILKKAYTNESQTIF